jgi:oxalate decarboxylase
MPGYVPLAYGHYIENRGDGTLRFLEMFRSSDYADIPARYVACAHPPPGLVSATLDLARRTISKLSKRETQVVR